MGGAPRLAAGEATEPAGCPDGLWTTLDDRSGGARSLVRIVVREGRLSGRISRIFLRPHEGPDPVCLRCKGARHGQKVVGMEILWGHRLEESRWVGGTVLDPENGREYRSSVWLEDADTLRVRGYWGPFHRTQTWRRARPDQEPPGSTEKGR